MTHVLIRDAGPRDSAWLQTLPEFPFEDVLNPHALTPGVHLVAEVDGTPVGALTASDNGDWLELTHVHVASDARRHGAGRALVVALQQAAHERARPRVLLEVRMDNTAARALYDSLGFTAFHTRKSYYSDGTDALEMEWRG